MAKTTLTIQASGVEATEAEIKAAVKDAWTAAGNKVKDMETVEIYVKPEEKKAYYVINGNVNGAVEL